MQKFPITLLVLATLLISACQAATPTPIAVVPTSAPTQTVAAQATDTSTPATETEIPTATTGATATRTATVTKTRTPRATASATNEPTIEASPTITNTATAEPTIELSSVDATQVANATGTAVVLLSATGTATIEASATVSPTATLSATIQATETVTPTVAASATASATATATTEPAPTAPTPGALPTASDGRYPKPQVAGFTVSIVANSAENPIVHPTSLAWGPDGAMYVSRQEGVIVRVAPDGTRTNFASLNVPVGLAFRPGTSDLYVSHRGGITILRDTNNDGVAESYQPFITGMACCYAELHQTNGLQFYNGWLYFSQGASSDHGEAPTVEWHAGILRVDPARGQESLEYVATGVRNAYDMVVRGDGQIFATDNGSDFGPPEELNHIIPGQDYGWPDCYSSAPNEVSVHPSHPESTRCGETRAAITTFVPHASANGITSYEANMFPAAYRGNLFVALWSHITDAYRIVRVQTSPSGDTFAATVTPFVTDFELPLDVAVGPDGALYVADWGPGRIYRIAYGE